MSDQRPDLISGCCRENVTRKIGLITGTPYYECDSCGKPCNIHQHECDGADCCKKRGPGSTGNWWIRFAGNPVWRQSPEDEQALVDFNNSIAELFNNAATSTANGLLEMMQARLTFIEARRVELQEMCELRTRELIEAKERIACLERCLGRLVAEREER